MNRSLVPEHFSAPLLIEHLQQLAERENLWRIRTIAKGGMVFGPESDCRDVFLLITGLVKLSYLAPGGGETIKSLVVDQGMFGREDNGPDFGAYAVEASQLVQLPQSWVLRQVSESEKLRQSYALFLDWIRGRKAERERRLLCLTPQERLLDFRKAEPDLIVRLPEGDIARYLGITPIAYSRIKRRLDLNAVATF